MQVLVDSSVWIDYFRGSAKSEMLDFFINQNMICINDLILVELIPALKISNQKKVIKLLKSIERIPLEISWSNVVDIQFRCLKDGINKVGIPDLIIIDNVLQNGLTLYSFDRHFELISKFKNFDLIN